VGFATILVVDDAADVLEVTVALLEQAGYGVVPCGGGREALAVLGAANAIDLLVTDITMPEMTGLELARHARVLRPSLPVCYLTGYAHALVNQAPVVMGPILRKPYRAAEFTRQVEQLLQPSEDERLVRAVALEMFEHGGDALDRAKQAEEIARLSGDEFSARAWRDIAEAIALLKRLD
jgi:CheY-like chemotaxis protein